MFFSTLSESVLKQAVTFSFYLKNLPTHQHIMYRHTHSDTHTHTYISINLSCVPILGALYSAWVEHQMEQGLCLVRQGWPRPCTDCATEWMCTRFTAERTRAWRAANHSFRPLLWKWGMDGRFYFVPASRDIEKERMSERAGPLLSSGLDNWLFMFGPILFSGDHRLQSKRNQIETHRDPRSRAADGKDVEDGVDTVL